MANTTLPNYENGGPLPFSFNYSPNCPINMQSSLIPIGSNVRWETVPTSPASVKHLYSGIPNHYESMYSSVPMDTIYGHDFSQTYPNGLGKKKIIGGGHYKVWPLTNQHTFESRNYSSQYFRKPGPISKVIYNHEITDSTAHIKSRGW